MDMYQKRKMRAEKKNNNNQENFPKVGINCLITINLITSANPYFIRDYKNFDNAYFIQK